MSCVSVCYVICMQLVILRMYIYIYMYVCTYVCMYVCIYIYIYILMVRRLAFPAPRLPLLPMAWSGRGGGVPRGGGGMCGELEPQLEVTESAGTLRKP